VSSRAPFITFEGGEGAGKTTQIKALKVWLEEKGHSVVTSREPGGTPGAEDIRNMIVQGHDSRWSPKTETLLFMAARSDHLDKVILPNIEKGIWVISDRFVDSTYAYQVYGRGLERSGVEDVYRFFAGDFLPDLTIIFDIDPKLGMKRAVEGKGRNLEENRFENMDFSFHEKLRAGYKDMAKKEPKRFVVLDIAETDTMDDVQNRLRAIVAERFKP
jgi:dTMP kinase